MRAYFKNMIQAYNGKCDGLVYYFNPRLNRILVRPHVKPRATEQTRKFAAIATNLKALAPSEGFKTDMKVYVDLYNRKLSRHATPVQNWYNAYTKMMYALESGDWKDESGEQIVVDLSTITRAFIYDNELPCISVKRAVEAGILASVNGYELLTQEI